MGKPPRSSIDFFLASLSTGRLDYRAGLAGYALSRHVAFHEFQELSGNSYCQVCGHTLKKNLVHRNLSNQGRFVNRENRHVYRNWVPQ